MATRLGRYRLLKPLARGGMAEIWLAQVRGVAGFEKLVVIKTMLPGLSANDDYIQMFADEARLAAQLSHPNIAQIHELGRTNDGVHFIAMEFVHGENLRSVLRATAKRGETGMPLGLAIRAASLSAEALHHAHTRKDLDGKPLGIIHRDVSPQNILMSFDGQVKVVDFGIAKAASSLTETRTGVVKGKHPYMSPEQVTGRKMDARSDIFALGAVLWELLAGQRLYNQDTDFLVMEAIVKHDPPPITDFRDDVSPALDAVIRKALFKDPEARYEDAAAMHRALERALRGLDTTVTAADAATWMEELFAERLELWRQVFGEREIGELGPEDLAALPGPEGASGIHTPSRRTQSLGPGMDLGDEDAEDDDEVTPPVGDDDGPELPVPAAQEDASNPELDPEEEAAIAAALAAHDMLQEAPDLEDVEDTPPPEPSVLPVRRIIRPPGVDDGPDPHEAPPPPKKKKKKKQQTQRVKKKGPGLFSRLGGALASVVKLAAIIATIGALVFFGRKYISRGDLKKGMKAIESVGDTLVKTAGIPRPGHLEVITIPDGATVTVGGKVLGKTPLDRDYKTKRDVVKVVIQKKGYVKVSRDVHNAKAGIRIELRLEPVGPPR